jgi:predicted metal-binding membrane protein
MSGDVITRATRRTLASFVLLGAAAWIAVVVIARNMGNMSGTMGLGIAAFVAIWTLMMAAMMLPSVAPFASFYTRTFTEQRARRLLAFGSGYLLVWAAAGLPAFGLAWIADRLVADHRTAAVVLAVLIFVACGVYQLSPLKDRCLAHCRNPLSFTLQYAAQRGRTRDLRAGASHGAFCLACCWTLMLLLLAFGLMNVLAMVVVAAAVLAEKTVPRGAALARGLGVAALAFAVVVAVHPAVVPGLHPGEQPMTMNGGM